MSNNALPGFFPGSLYYVTANQRWYKPAYTFRQLFLHQPFTGHFIGAGRCCHLSVSRERRSKSYIGLCVSLDTCLRLLRPFNLVARTCFRFGALWGTNQQQNGQQLSLRWWINSRIQVILPGRCLNELVASRGSIQQQHRGMIEQLNT